MKNSLTIILVLVAFSQCTAPSAEENLTAEKTMTLDEALPEQRNQAIKINAAFPFGSIALSRYTYPHRWEVNPYEENKPESAASKEIAEISTELSTLLRAPAIATPEIKDTMFLAINTAYETDYYFDTAAAKTLDSCLYRLPDINGYQCFYCIAQSKRKSYGSYGNLLLLNPTSLAGTIITAYFEYGGDQHVNLRYFLMDGNQLNLYEGFCYDDGTTLDKTYTIDVLPDGKISSKKFHGSGME